MDSNCICYYWKTDALCHRLLSQNWPESAKEKEVFVQRLTEAALEVVKITAKEGKNTLTELDNVYGHFLSDANTSNGNFQLRILATSILVRVCTGLEDRFVYLSCKDQKSAFEPVLELVEKLLVLCRSQCENAVRSMLLETLKQLFNDLKLKGFSKEAQYLLLSQSEAHLSRKEMETYTKVIEEKSPGTVRCYETYAKGIFDTLKLINAQLRTPYLLRMLNNYNKKKSASSQRSPSPQFRYKKYLKAMEECQKLNATTSHSKTPEKQAEKTNRYSRRWTVELDKFLIDGIKKFGYGDWAKIRDTYPFPAWVGGVALKDRCKIMRKHNLLVVNDSKKIVDMAPCYQSVMNASQDEDIEVVSNSERPKNKQSTSSSPKKQPGQTEKLTSEFYAAKKRKQHKKHTRSIYFS